MNRRTLLQRLPALPFALGAAVSQGPAVVKGIASVLMLEAQNAPQAMPTEVAFATRLQWFTQAVNGWLLQYRPNVLMPAEDAQWTPAVQRAIVLWTNYVTRIAQQATDEGIPAEMAAQIANVPEHLLRELMH